MDIWNSVYVKDDKFYSKETNSLFNGEIETTHISIEEISESEDEESKIRLLFSKGMLHGKFEKLLYNSHNETVKFIGEFENGNGIITGYDKNNNVTSTGDYHLDFFYFGKDKSQPSFHLRILNEVEIYNEEGDIKRRVESFYENNRRLTRHYYYDKGKIDYYETLSNIDRHGEYKDFYDNGNIKSVCEYKDDRNGGMKHGFYKEYYPTGRLKVEGSYRDNIKDGRWVEYYKNGVVKSDGYHVKEKRFNQYGEKYVHIRKGGSKDGIWKYYDKNKTLIKQETWSHGFKHGYYFERNDDGTKSHLIFIHNKCIGQDNFINRLRFKLSNNQVVRF